jgi:Uma2 family endonuclease
MTEVGQSGGCLGNCRWLVNFSISFIMITDINQLDFTKRYSYADYLKWKFEERLELIKGYSHKMSHAPARKHQELVGSFHGMFWAFLKGKEFKVYSAPFDVRLPNKKGNSNESTFTVLQPDLCVVCNLDKLDDRGCVGAPDLIIEVLSPGNTDKEIKLKYDIYEESGVKEYWVVQPEYKSVLVYLLNNDGRLLDSIH